jgi:hypothetical protein
MLPEAAAYELLERLRWGARPPPVCPLCGAAGRCFFLTPRSVTGRRTRTGAPTARRVWKCGTCRRQFSVLAGTVLQGTRARLGLWIAAVADWSGRGSLPDAGELTRRYGAGAAAARQVHRRLTLTVTVEPVRTELAAARGVDGLLGALLDIPPADAAQIRERTPARQRPRRQDGPSAEYGRA